MSKKEAIIKIKKLIKLEMSSGFNHKIPIAKLSEKEKITRLISGGGSLIKKTKYRIAKNCNYKF